MVLKAKSEHRRKIKIKNLSCKLKFKTIGLSVGMHNVYE